MIPITTAPCANRALDCIIVAAPNPPMGHRNVTLEKRDSDGIISPINDIIRNGVSDVNNSNKRQLSDARYTTDGRITDIALAGDKNDREHSPRTKCSKPILGKRPFPEP